MRSLVLVIDASFKLSNHHSERLFERYIVKYTSLLSETLPPGDDFQVACVIVYARSPYLLQPFTIHKWTSITEALANITTVLQRLADPKGKGRALEMGHECALLDGLVAGLELLNDISTDSSKHMLLLTASDIPSLQLTADIYDGDVCTTNSSSSFDNTTWHSLANRFKDGHISFSLMTTQYLPLLESWYEQLVPDASSNLIPLLHAEHSIRLSGISQAQARLGKRSHDDLTAGTSPERADTESAKRSRITLPTSSTNVIDLISPEQDAAAVFADTALPAVQPSQPVPIQATTAVKSTEAGVAVLIAQLTNLIPSLAGKNAEDAVQELTTRMNDVSSNSAQAARNVQQQVSSGMMTEADAKRSLEELKQKAVKQRVFLENAVHALRMHLGRPVPAEAAPPVTHFTAASALPASIPEGPQTLWQGSIRTTYVDPQTGQDKQLIGYVSAKPVNPNATDLLDAQQTWPSTLNVDQISIVDLQALQNFVTVAKIPVVSLSPTPNEVLANNPQLSQQAVQNNAAIVRHFAKSLHQRKSSAWTKIGDGNDFGILLMSQNGLSLVAPVFTSVPIPSTLLQGQGQIISPSPKPDMPQVQNVNAANIGQLNLNQFLPQAMQDTQFTDQMLSLYTQG